MSSEQAGETFASARLSDALGSEAVLPARRGSVFSILRQAVAPPRMAAARNGLTYRYVVIAGSAIFILSNALIVPGLAPAPALLVLAGCIGSLWIVVKGAAAAPSGLLTTRVDPRTLALCWGTALALCVLGGEAHFFFANYDWFNRDAVLADLVRQRFPVFYQYEGAEFFLRAPLGMYLVPAAAGKAFGLAAAHLVLLAQNATLLALILALLCTMAPHRRAIFLAVFVTFSGVELVGRYINAAVMHPGEFSWWPLHAHQHIAWWNPLFQYTNHLTQIFWVPNHSLPGWWLAALTILHVRREVDSTVLIVAFASLVFWSPLTMAGALPVVGLLVLCREFKALLTPRILAACAAGLCFLPIAAYMAADAEAVPHLWFFTWDGFWGVYVLFIAIELPHIAVVALYWRRLDAGLRLVSILAIGMLLAIPLYRLGSNNDFSMRASILPLALFAVVFASIVAQMRWRDGVARVAAVAAIIVLGSVAPATEVQRALDFKAFAISDCNVLTAWHLLEPNRWLSNYFARADRAPAWLLAHGSADAPVAIEDRQCWPDHPYRARNLPMTEWSEPDRW